MSMTFKILLFLLLIVASATFISALGIFEEDYITVPEGGDYSSYTIDNLNESIGIGANDTVKPGILGGLTMIGLLWQGIMFLYNMILSLPSLITTVVRMFNVPAPLVGFIGVGISAIIVWEVAQFLTGRSGKNVE